MEETRPGPGLQDIVLRPVYLRAVNAIVQPEQQLPCSVYFFREWLPRLGSLRWALVIALRHLCTNRQSDGVSRGEVSRSELAAVLGVHEVTISRLLSTTRSKVAPGWRVLEPAGPDDTATAFLARFIPRLRYKYARDATTGTTRRVGYIIDVVMDDPLVPEDEQKLALVLAEQILSGGNFEPLHNRAGETAKRPPQGVKCQTATSLSAVNEHDATSPSIPSKQPATSRPPVTAQPASSTSVKAQDGPGLTLTSNFNYRDITIPLTLTKKHEIRRAVAPLVEYAATALNDNHSVGMFYSTLAQLYPDSLGLFTEALEQAMEVGAWNPKTNLGAVFVNILKETAREQGIALRLGKASPAATLPPPSPVAEAQAEREEQLDDGGESAPPEVERRSVYIPDVGMSSVQVWQSILQELKRTTSRANYEMWLKNCYLASVEADVVVIGAPNQFTRDWVRDRLQGAIGAAVRRVLGRDVAVRCAVAGEEGLEEGRVVKATKRPHGRAGS